MKKTILAIACTALAAPMAFAQAKNFEGLSLGANITSTKTTFDSTLGSSDGTTTGVDIQVQYNFTLSPEFVLGVGASLGTSANKAGSLLGNDFSLKSRSAFELTPGFTVSKDVLLFGKIAALSATADDGRGGTDTVSGVGYGLGVRGMVDKNMYWQVGYDLNTYGEKNLASGLGTYKFKSTALSLGLGYKF